MMATMRRPRLGAVIAAGLLAGGCGRGTERPPLPPGDAGRGRAVIAAAAGCGCHTEPAGPVGAGGYEIQTPFGTFYGTNITPDPETGIGAWSDAEIDAAIRAGVVKGRGAEAPVMPYYRYAGMSDDDVADLIAYLRTLPPVRRTNTPHALRLPFARLAFWGWRLLFGAPMQDGPGGKGAAVARGRYLVKHVSICGDCHTPRNLLGVPDQSLDLAGAARGPDGEPAPNITPDRRTGIGEWAAEDIATLLESGMKPDFDNVQGLMAEVVEGRGGGLGFMHMPAADREAIAAYLRTVPPVENDVAAE
jgi:mono/diheme cytochrome c family protein